MLVIGQNPMKIKNTSVLQIMYFKSFSKKLSSVKNIDVRKLYGGSSKN